MEQMAILGNVPTITNATHSHTTYDGIGTTVDNTFFESTTALGVGLQGSPSTARMAKALNTDTYVSVMREVQAEKQKEKAMAKSTRRLVKVIIIDTDENVPLDKCVLYSGDEKLTDATDQELFFEIDIKNILDKHNEYRITLKDKSVKERVENLEPVKIRDLRMVVVNVATF
jgi:ribosomal protein L4